MQLWTPLQIPTSRIIEPIRDHSSSTVLWKPTIRYFTSSRSRRRWFEQLFNWWKFDWKRIEWIFDWWNERCEFDQGFECWNRWNRCGYFRSPRLRTLPFLLSPSLPLSFILLPYEPRTNERTMDDEKEEGEYIIFRRKGHWLFSSFSLAYIQYEISYIVMHLLNLLLPSRVYERMAGLERIRRCENSRIPSSTTTLQRHLRFEPPSTSQTLQVPVQLNSTGFKLLQLLQVALQASSLDNRNSTGTARIALE